MSKSKNKQHTPEEIVKDIDSILNIIEGLGHIEDIETFNIKEWEKEVTKINSDLEKKYGKDVDTEIEGCTPE